MKRNLVLLLISALAATLACGAANTPTRPSPEPQAKVEITSFTPGPGSLLRYGSKITISTSHVLPSQTNSLETVLLIRDDGEAVTNGCSGGNSYAGSGTTRFDIGAAGFPNGFPFADFLYEFFKGHSVTISVLFAYGPSIPFVGCDYFQGPETTRFRRPIFFERAMIRVDANPNWRVE